MSSYFTLSSKFLYVVFLFILIEILLIASFVKYIIKRESSTDRLFKALRPKNSIIIVGFSLLKTPKTHYSKRQKYLDYIFLLPINKGRKEDIHDQRFNKYKRSQLLESMYCMVPK